MRVAPCVSLMALGLALTGCSLFDKKPSNAAATPPRVNDGPIYPTSNNRLGALSSDPSAPPAGVNGVLAGQIIDSYNRKPQSAVYIQVTEARDRGNSAAAPIEVAADNQGYFTIQGLQPGRHYQLTARSRDGDHLMAGSTWATPPAPTILIRISEDLASATTPPIPGAPAWPGPNRANGIQPPAPPSLTPEQNQGRSDQAWAPGRSGAAGAAVNPARGAEIGAPLGVSGVPANPAPYSSNPPASTQGVEVRPDLISNEDKLAKGPPVVSVPSQSGQDTVVPPATDTPEAPNSPGDGTRVPSCALTGQTLNNFALNDLSGQPWEYRRNHRGRMVLLDFWAPWCVPCLHAIPHLTILQRNYGPKGLEVIGIAYEGGTQAERIQKINRVRQRLEINYQILLGTELGNCPVQNQFGVVRFPTLVLLDDQGRIVWRGEGLDGEKLRQLDSLIRNGLGIR